MGSFITPGVLQFRKWGTLTINQSLCGTTDSSNFTVLVDVTDNSLRTVANGGYVTNANGFDILFTTSPSGISTSWLSWEIEFYNAATGHLVAWVKLATVSHTLNTVFYIIIGQTSLTTFQGGATGAAWNANYKTVWHLPNGTTLSAADSTTTANNGTLVGPPTATSGQIDGAASFTGTQYIGGSDASFPATNTARSVCFWAFPTTVDSNYHIAVFYGTYSATNMFEVGIADTNNWFISNYGGALLGTAAVANTWYHVVATYSTTNGLKIYVNGSLANTSTSITINTALGVMRVGDEHEPTEAAFFKGKIDEVQVMNVEVDLSWITKLYNNQRTASGFLTLVMQ